MPNQQYYLSDREVKTTVAIRLNPEAGGRDGIINNSEKSILTSCRQLFFKVERGLHSPGVGGPSTMVELHKRDSANLRDFLEQPVSKSTSFRLSSWAVGVSSRIFWVVLRFPRRKSWKMRPRGLERPQYILAYS